MEISAPFEIELFSFIKILCAHRKNIAADAAPKRPHIKLVALAGLCGTSQVNSLPINTHNGKLGEWGMESVAADMEKMAESSQKGPGAAVKK